MWRSDLCNSAECNMLFYLLAVKHAYFVYLSYSAWIYVGNSYIYSVRSFLRCHLFVLAVFSPILLLRIVSFSLSHFLTTIFPGLPRFTVFVFSARVFICLWSWRRFVSCCPSYSAFFALFLCFLCVVLPSFCFRYFFSI